MLILIFLRARSCPGNACDCLKLMVLDRHSFESDKAFAMGMMIAEHNQNSSAAGGAFTIRMDRCFLRLDF